MTAPESLVPESLVAELQRARRILVVTGAGISTRSGIGDYRGPSGRWKVRDPVMFQDFMSRRAARVEYWDQKLETWPSIRDAKPNAAHRAIVELEEAGRLELLVTQNIDGLHRSAGSSAERTVEIHGTNLEVACMSCGVRESPQRHFEAFESTREPPVCDACGGWMKPATISFGQSLESSDLERSFAAAGRCDLVLALGSTLGVHPVASVPLVAAEAGARYVIVNRGITEHDGLPSVTLRLDGDVTELLPAAVAVLPVQKPGQLPSSPDR